LLAEYSHQQKYTEDCKVASEEDLQCAASGWAWPTGRLQTRFGRDSASGILIANA
jgi:hypothetical protein